MGGTLAAIENGFIQSEIQNAAYAYQQTVERGDTVVVGVNKFQQDSGRSARHLPSRSRARKTAGRPRSRPCAPPATPPPSTPASARSKSAARSSDNLMPHILACAEVYATVGEISDRLRAVFGEYHER